MEEKVPQPGEEQTAEGAGHKTGVGYKLWSVRPVTQPWGCAVLSVLVPVFFLLHLGSPGLRLRSGLT